MSELIAKLRAAKEGSRELDALIWAAILPRDGTGLDGLGCPENAHYFYEAHEDGSVDQWVTFHSGIKDDARRARRAAPKFTDSFDAARTLVPDGGFSIIQEYDGTGSAIVGHDRWINGKTIVLALCIAALRARSLVTGGGEEGKNG